jgi:hypothetical protein
MKKSLLLLFMLGALLNDSSAALFTVSNTNDAGAGSLRQALTSANADNSATNGSPHIINATLTGTITLASALPDLANHMVITGPIGGGLIIDGASTYRIFVVAATYSVTLNTLTLQHGAPGAAFGGAIQNAGTLRILNCTIQNNSVTATGQGGGISNSGTGILYIDNSTLNNNLSSNTGGAIVNYGNAYLSNCTLFANTAGTGGGVMNYKVLSVLNCSIINNSDGIIYDNSAGASLVIENSILLGSTSYYDLDIANSGNVVASYSIIGTYGSSVQGFTGSGNITTTTILAIYGTATLSNNGGTTKTVALPGTSAAVNAGAGSNAPSTDQRGNNRVGTADMGSYEYDPATGVLNKTASQDFIKISSNPGNGLFNAEISTELTGNFEWKIIDNNGRLVKSGPNFSKGNGAYSFAINLTDQASGTYYLILSSDKGAYSQVLIKQ